MTDMTKAELVKQINELRRRIEEMRADNTKERDRGEVLKLEADNARSEAARATADLNRALGWIDCQQGKRPGGDEWPRPDQYGNTYDQYGNRIY